MEIFLPIAGVEIMAWKLILLGFTVGVIGGFFGVGGAFMVTPALNVFGFPMAYAIGTDMAHIAGKSIVATAKHRKFGNVDMKLGALMIVGTAIGIELGANFIMWLEKIANSRRRNNGLEAHTPRLYRRRHRWLFRGRRRIYGHAGT